MTTTEFPAAMSARPPAVPAGIAASLPSSVEQFLRSTDQAERAFDALSRRVEELKSALDETNQKLRDKVAELDRLSGHLMCLLESMTDGVVALDGSEVIRFFNPAAERLTGLKSSAIVGRLASEWLGQHPRLLKLIREALADRNVQARVRFKLGSSGGATVPACAAVASVLDRSGLPIGAVIVIQDLSQLASLQNQLRQSADLAAIGRMAAMVAHEIRNPLGGIQGFASLLKSDLAGQPKPQRYAELIVQGLKDMDGIVGSLLGFSRAPALKWEQVDLARMLPELFDLMAESRPGIRGRIRFSMQGLRELAAVRADRGALRQIFLNLMRNAVEAMEPQQSGQVAVRIEHGRLEGEAAVAISVVDSGPGIPAGARQGLFQPFVTTKETGTGLGLPTVAKLVEAHGGQVEYRDEPGGGACFQVVLPLDASTRVPENSHAN